MSNVERLLDYLNKMFPLSIGFLNELPPMMIEKRKKSGYVFLKAGSVAVKAWQLITGFILAIKTDDDGLETVARIYYPKQIVTDLTSFFEGVAVNYKYVAVGNVTVLEIKRADVLKLKVYPETHSLIQHISFLDLGYVNLITDMLRCPEKERVELFLKEYPVQNLPHKYCASILNLSEDLYIENQFLLESEGLSLAKMMEPDENFEESVYSPYKVKTYLQNNYPTLGFGSVDDIAKHFNTTEKTLNRLFKSSYGLTISKFILKCRMDKALELLQMNGLQTGETANFVGYKSLHHFSREFKKYFGYSPTTIK